MAKKNSGKAVKPAKAKTAAPKIALPKELGGGAVDLKTLTKHPLVAELAAQALEAMAAELRAKLTKATAPKPAPVKAVKPIAEKPAPTAKAAAPRRAPRKPTAPGTDTTQ